MPEDQESTEQQGQESADGTEQAEKGAEKSGQADASADDAQSFSREYVKTLRDEAAANRKKAKDAEAKLKALEDEKLSEAEKKDRRLKELEDENGKLRRTAREASIAAEAAAAGAVNPSRVARLIDDEEEDVKRAVAALKKSDPYLFARSGTGSADGGAGGGGLKGQSANDVIRRMAGRS